MQWVEAIGTTVSSGDQGEYLSLVTIFSPQKYGISFCKLRAALCTFHALKLLCCNFSWKFFVSPKHAATLVAAGHRNNVTAIWALYLNSCLKISEITA